MRYIDGLRAVAVLSVVVHHAVLHSPALPNPTALAFPFNLLVEGAHGVDLFFVLSGYCLAFPVLRALRETGASVFDLAAFGAKRLIRIVPPYYAAIVLFAFVVHASPVSWMDVIKQALFLDRGTHFLNGSFWTLCIEFRWYFIFPLALVAFVRFPKLVVAIALAAPLVYEATRLRAIDVGTLMPFLLGIVAADWHLRGHALQRRAPVLMLVCVLAGLLIEPWLTTPLASGGEGPIFFEQTNPGWQLAAFFCVVAGGSSRLFGAVLRSKPLVATGIASYSIYLVHEPLITLAEARLPLPPAAAAIVASLAALAAGFAFWAILERPWVAGPLRNRMLAFLKPRLASLLGRLGLPATTAFGSSERMRVEAA